MHEQIHHPDREHHLVVEPHIEFTPIHHDVVAEIVEVPHEI